jgi:DnaJ-class molecular chaperone
VQEPAEEEQEQADEPAKEPVQEPAEEAKATREINDQMNAYEILGLDPIKRDTTNLKKNYMELARLYHSDKGGDDYIMQLINQSYAILLDKNDKKEEYDKELSEGNQEPVFNYGGSKKIKRI